MSGDNHFVIIADNNDQFIYNENQGGGIYDEDNQLNEDSYLEDDSDDDEDDDSSQNVSFKNKVQKAKWTTEEVRIDEN